MRSIARAVRLGFWSSVVILVSGAVLLAGIVASALTLPSALTTDWQGVDAYATAYRATGGILTSLPFLAALVSCPAYVLQIVSLHGLASGAGRIRRGLGVASALAFALLAGLNYVVQMTLVRTGILGGQDLGLSWLVFQNPDSLMLAIDFAGWFLLGLAFLSVLPLFQEGRLDRAIRILVGANAGAGFVLLASVVAHVAEAGQALLAVMSALLTGIDILLLIFFRRIGSAGSAALFRSPSAT